ESASGTVLTCGFARRTLAALPSGALYDGIARSIAEVRPTTHVVRGDHREGWIAIEGSGVASQSLAVRLAHIHPDIADAASRLHTRSDIEWANPLLLTEPKDEAACA